MIIMGVPPPPNDIPGGCANALEVGCSSPMVERDSETINAELIFLIGMVGIRVNKSTKL
jgi:hypothetical protein